MLRLLASVRWHEARDGRRRRPRRSTGCRDEKHSCATRAALSQFFSRDDGMASTAARMAWSPVAHGMHGGRAGSSARIRTGTADVRRPATSRCGGMRSVTCSSPSGVKRREGRSFANREETVSLDSLRLEQLCGTAERARNRWQCTCLEPPQTYTRRTRQRLVLHVLALTMRRSRSIRRAVLYRCLARERSAYGGVLKTDAPV